METRNLNYFLPHFSLFLFFSSHYILTVVHAVEPSLSHAKIPSRSVQTPVHGNTRASTNTITASKKKYSMKCSSQKLNTNALFIKNYLLKIHSITF